jgi:hypothetical protein
LSPSFIMRLRNVEGGSPRISTAPPLPAIWPPGGAAPPGCTAAPCRPGGRARARCRPGPLPALRARGHSLGTRSDPRTRVMPADRSKSRGPCISNAKRTRYDATPYDPQPAESPVTVPSRTASSRRHVVARREISCRRAASPTSSLGDPYLHGSKRGDRGNRVRGCGSVCPSACHPSVPLRP